MLASWSLCPGWLESLPGCLEFLPGWLKFPFGWLISLSGQLVSPPGWLESLPSWLESLPVYFSGSLCVWLSVDSKTLCVHVAGCMSLCLQCLLVSIESILADAGGKHFRTSQAPRPIFQHIQLQKKIIQFHASINLDQLYDKEVGICVLVLCSLVHRTCKETSDVHIRWTSEYTSSKCKHGKMKSRDKN